jgi:hypothetical protein
LVFLATSTTPIIGEKEFVMNTEPGPLYAAYALGYKEGANRGVIVGGAIVLAALIVKRHVKVNVRLRKKDK